MGWGGVGDNGMDIRGERDGVTGWWGEAGGGADGGLGEGGEWKDRLKSPSADFASVTAIFDSRGRPEVNYGLRSRNPAWLYLYLTLFIYYTTMPACNQLCVAMCYST